MPTLTTVNANALPSVLEDSLLTSPNTRVGFNYANFLTAGNESSDTDGFQINSIFQGKLYYNTGSTTTANYVEITSAMLAAGSTTNPLAAGTLGITVRLTGIFNNNTKLSGSDSKLYWEPNLATNTNGLQGAFSIRAIDNGNSTWNDGVADTVSSTSVLVSINVTAVNDAPTFTLIPSQNVIEDNGATTFSAASAGTPGGGADEAGQTLTYSIVSTVTSGGLTFSATPTIDASTGMVSYTSAPDSNGSAVITVKLMDNGGTTNGGVDATTKSFVLNVTAVNDAPVNTVPGSQAAVAGTIAFNAFNGNDLSVADVDAGGGIITTTLSVTTGTLAATLSGAATVSGSATNTVVITGSLTDVNNTLQSVVFSGTGDSTLTMLTSDNGNTGTPGALTDTDMVSIGVAPTVIDVTEPTAGFFNAGDPISYTVHYDSAVTVTGTPRIAITLTSGTVYATYASGSTTADLLFTYTVGGADNDADGIAAGTVIDLNGGTLQSAGGTNAFLTLAGQNATPGVIVDTLAPNAPAALDLIVASDSGVSSADDITNVTTPTITGTGENGATVTLSSNINGVVGTAVVSGGVWSITSTTLTAGAQSLTATQTDLAGNVSAASSALAITLDTTVAAPATLDLVAGSDSGTSNSDNITNVTTPTITGTGENGATVTLTSNLNGSVGTAVVAGGVWSITTSTLTAGAQSLTATQTDVAGNVSVASGALAITLDTTAAAPAALDLAITSDSGTSGTDNITNDTTPTITGTGENGATVTLSSAGDGVVGSTTVSGGVWSITATALTPGAQSLTATQTDLAGNVSVASAPLAITLDITAAAPTALDLAVASDTGISDTDDITKTTTPTITGLGEVGAFVTLTSSISGGTVGTATVDAMGGWSVTTSILGEGAHSLTATQVDIAGNLSVASTSLVVTVDTTPPATPGTPDLAAADDSGISVTDNITNLTSALTFSGTGENGSTVVLYDDVDNSGTVNLGDVSLGSVVAGGGVYTLDVALAAGVHHVIATSTDVAGNTAVSGSTTVTVDTDAPAAPAALDLDTASDSGSSTTDNITNVTTPTITGTGENGATVTLTSSVDAIVGTAVVVGGVWSITATTLTAGAQSLTATQTDVAGNTSVASTALAITVDITAPAVPSAPDLDAFDDTGVSNTDNITKNTTGLTFSGTGENGSTVSLFNDADDSGTFNVGDTILGTGLVSSGAWSIDSSTLTQNTYVIRAFATDVAGNASAASVGATVLQVTVDTTAPAAPSQLDLLAADDSGSSNTDNLTNVNAGFTLSGTAAANAVVTIFQGTTSLGTATASGAGAFNFVVAGPVADGTYAYTATQVDVAGNVSAASTTLSVTIDTVGPAVSYDVAHYDANLNTLTIQGVGFNTLGAANATTNIKAQLVASGLSFDLNNDGIADYTLANADVASAYVTDAKTLVLTLNSTANVIALEGNGNFGVLGSTTLNPLDSIVITTAFAGTDAAGNSGTGSTLGIQVLGAQNSVDIPHVYSANLALAPSATDDTLGEEQVSAYLNTNAASSLTVNGSSAAQTSLYSFGVGNYYYLSQLDAFNSGSSHILFIQAFDSTSINTQLGFADGSIIRTNEMGASSTSSGTKFDDQLIAGNNGDRLLGNAGNDLLVGGNGSDAIYGGSGNDVMYGGAGNDYLSGGTGHDTFIYTPGYGDNGYDVITGFVGANNFNAASSSDVINVVGGNAAALLAASTQSGSDTLVVIDSSHTIRLLGVAASELTLANFGTSDVVLKGNFYS